MAGRRRRVQFVWVTKIDIEPMEEGCVVLFSFNHSQEQGDRQSNHSPSAPASGVWRTPVYLNWQTQRHSSCQPLKRYGDKGEGIQPTIKIPQTNSGRRHLVRRGRDGADPSASKALRPGKTSRDKFLVLLWNVSRRSCFSFTSSSSKL